MTDESKHPPRKTYGPIVCRPHKKAIRALPLEILLYQKNCQRFAVDHLQRVEWAIFDLSVTMERLGVWQDFEARIVLGIGELRRVQAGFGMEPLRDTVPLACKVAASSPGTRLFLTLLEAWDDLLGTVRAAKEVEEADISALNDVYKEWKARIRGLAREMIDVKETRLADAYASRSSESRDSRPPQ